MLSFCQGIVEGNMDALDTLAIIIQQTKCRGGRWLTVVCNMNYTKHIFWLKQIIIFIKNVFKNIIFKLLKLINF